MDAVKSEHLTEHTTLLNGAVHLYQPVGGYRANHDSVFLPAFAKVSSGQKILDLGCGVGSGALCLNARVSGLDLFGIEIDDHYAELAKQNFAANHLSPANILNIDIADKQATLRQNFDHIICNPPYFEGGKHTQSEDPSKARARGAVLNQTMLEDWFSAFRYYLKPNGGLTLIQRADMLDKILGMLAPAFGAVEVLPIYSKENSYHANRVLIRGLKGRKTPLKILRPFIVHHADGGDTQEAQSILQHKASLRIDDEVKVTN